MRGRGERSEEKRREDVRGCCWRCVGERDASASASLKPWRRRSTRETEVHDRGSEDEVGEVLGREAGSVGARDHDG